MDYPTVALIAVGLAMDGLAVSITAGATAKKKADTFIKSALAAGVFFGGFQALMPILGWFAGQGAKEIVMNIDHWVAFLLLGFIGAKMLLSAKKGKNERVELLNLPTLTVLAIATSIDAFVVGITFAFLNFPIIQAAAIIGLITFILCFSGVVFGHSIKGKTTGRFAEAFGGLVLIAMGLKILVEHLYG
ncbi:MAG: manganese efflux pump MntP family protein [Candidatus Micrarchaeota archaeon]